MSTVVEQIELAVAFHLIF